MRPHCFMPISGPIWCLALFMSILRSIFMMWLIRPIVWWCFTIDCPWLFGPVINIDILRSSGIIPVSYMSFNTHISFLIQKISGLIINSVAISSGPVACSFFLCTGIFLLLKSGLGILLYLLWIVAFPLYHP